MRARRRAVAAMVGAVLALAAVLALVRVAEGSEASVALLAAVSQRGPSVAVDSVRLTGASGSVLSAGTVEATIRSGGGSVGISNDLSLTLDGVIAALKLDLSMTSSSRP